MIMGWHNKAIKFVQKHQTALSEKPVAYFMTAMSLTQTHQTQVGSTPIFIDGESGPAAQGPQPLELQGTLCAAGAITWGRC